MSVAKQYDDFFYLFQNPDVLNAVISKSIDSGFEHFEIFGARELRAPNSLFSPTFYVSQNIDVVVAINAGFFESGFHHYQLFGESENRSPSTEF